MHLHLHSPSPCSLVVSCRIAEVLAAQQDWDDAVVQHDRVFAQRLEVASGQMEEDYVDTINQPYRPQSPRPNVPAVVISLIDDSDNENQPGIVVFGVTIEAPCADNLLSNTHISSLTPLHL